MILLLSGWKKSGKDTGADYLINTYGFQRVSFADKLKEKVAQDFDVPLKYMHDQNLKELPLLQYPVESKDAFSEHVNNYMTGEHATVPCSNQKYHTPRSLCILMGSVMRSVDSNYWVKYAITGLDPDKNYVISDLRYKSEVAGVNGLYTGRVVSVRINRFDVNTSTDASENDLNDYNFDHVIENKGTLEEYLHKLDNLMKEIE